MKPILLVTMAVTVVVASCSDGAETNSTSGEPTGVTSPAPSTTPAPAAAPMPETPSEVARSATTVPTTGEGTTMPSTTTTTSTTSTTSESGLAVVPIADDVAYASASDLQRLDVYTPSVGEPPYPVAIIIHGGGWTTGDKRGELTMSATAGFLDLGFAVASINYRLAPDAVFPAQLLDVKAAIRYLRANAASLDLDPGRFAAIGESAGGHLASLVGVTEHRPEFDDPELGNPGVSSAVQAVVVFYGPSDLVTSDAQRALNPPCPAEPDPNIPLLLGATPTDTPALAAAASPATYLGPDSDPPPFYIAHGDADCVVPYQQSVELAEAIEAVAPGRSQLTIVAGSGHYLDFDFQSTNAAVITFLTDSLT